MKRRLFAIVTLLALVFSFSISGTQRAEGAPLASLNSASARVTVTDIGPHIGPSYGVEGFVINRNDPQQLLLPSASGIFKSTDGGQHWKRVNVTGLFGSSTGAGAFVLRQDPNNPLIVYAMTQNFDEPLLPFTGVRLFPFAYRSTDFGETWEQVNSNFIIGIVLMDCAIGQASSQSAFVLTPHSVQGNPDGKDNTALFKSLDGGVFQPQFNTGLPQYLSSNGRILADPYYTNIATTPTDPSVVYIVVNYDYYGHYAPGIYKSVDGGQTFSPLKKSPPRPLQIFPHPTNPKVLFVRDSSNLSSPGIYRSQDGGASFQPVGAGLPQDKWNYFVAFDPSNPGHVYVAGEAGLFRSTDGGTRFQPLGLRPEQIGLGATTATIDPTSSNVMYVSTTRGNFKSVDAGLSFAAISNSWESAPSYEVERDNGFLRLIFWTGNGISAAFPNSLAFDNAAKPSLYVSVPSAPGILKTQTRGLSYDSISNPLPARLTSNTAWPSSFAISPIDSNVIVAATRDRGVFRTTDGGLTWTKVSIDTGQQRFLPKLSKIAFDRMNPNRVYLVSADGGGSPGFYRSTDGGLTFRRTFFYPLSQEFSRELSSFATFTVDPSDPDVIYTASIYRGNVLLKSNDGGSSFVEMPLGAFAFDISDIEVDPGNSNNMYVGGSFVNVPYEDIPLTDQAVLIRSTDGGVSFVKADIGFLGTGALISLVIDPTNPSRLFSWTTDGLYMSTDAARNWTPLENNETPKVVRYESSMAINPKKPNLLYLSGATVLEVEVK